MNSFGLDEAAIMASALFASGAKVTDNNKYDVKLYFENGLSQFFENAVDVICNDDILAVVFEKKIYYYRIKHLLEWTVDKI